MSTHSKAMAARATGRGLMQTHMLLSVQTLVIIL